MNVLSNIDIISILHNYDISHNGVYSKDLLPEELHDGWYIINLQNHGDGGGTHWTCFKKSSNSKSIYFDSFGFDAPAHLHKSLGDYVFNKREIQDLDSSACGYFCIALIKYCQPSYPNSLILFNRFLAQFSNNTLLNNFRLFHFL